MHPWTLLGHFQLSTFGISCILTGTVQQQQTEKFSTSTEDVLTPFPLLIKSYPRSPGSSNYKVGRWKFHQRDIILEDLNLSNQKL